jgi:hypothetical protein
MLWTHVAVSPQDEHLAVATPLPVGDDFHVHAKLDCASDKHPAQTAVGEVRKAESRARFTERLARFANREQTIVIRLASATFLN